MPTANGTPAVLGGVGLQVLGLQRLHVILVDFKRGAELYGQSGQDVVPGHQEKRLAIDFLTDGGDGDTEVSLVESHDGYQNQFHWSGLCCQTRSLPLVSVTLLRLRQKKPKQNTYKVSK